MIVDEGEIAILGQLLRNPDIDAEIGLFTNIITIALDTVLGDLTEATFSGYARIASSSLTWPGPTTNMDSEAESDGPLLTFEADADPGSPIDVTGIFVTIKDDSDEEKLFMAYSFPDPETNKP
jgi:hypothetical protein